jgi:cystathionine beta-lyase
MAAERAFAVSTGMSALDVITRLVRCGEEIITGDDLYGGTLRILFTHTPISHDLLFTPYT